MREVIVATMRCGVDTVGAVDPAAPPTTADLDAIADRLVAENCGVRPTVRVVEEVTLPRFTVENPGPVCEDAWCSPPMWSSVPKRRRRV